MATLKFPSNKSVRKKYSVDWAKELNFSGGIIAKNNKLTQSPNFIRQEGSLFSQEEKPLRFYKVDNQTFVYTQSGRVHLLEGNSFTWTSGARFTAQPQLMEVYHEGIKYIMVFGFDRFSNFITELVNAGEVLFDVVIYPINVTINNLFWMTDGSSLYFQYVDAQERVDRHLNPKSQLLINANYGEILGLFGIENTLLVVCKHALLKVKTGAYPIDFIADRIDTEILNIDAKSVVGFGNNVYFVSNGTFCVFNDKTLVHKSNLLSQRKLSIVDTAGEDKGHYILPVQDENGEKCMLCIDTVSGQEYTLDYFDALSKNGGIALDKTTLSACCFEVDLANDLLAESNCYLVSKPISFGTTKKKRLLGIECILNGQGELTVSGDFGQVRYALNEYTDIACNLQSVAFTFSVRLDGQSLPIEAFKLIYSIQGE